MVLYRNAIFAGVVSSVYSAGIVGKIESFSADLSISGP
jgi:hypothetical protein